MAGYYGKNYEKPDDALVESSQESSTPAADYSDSPYYEGNANTNSDAGSEDYVAEEDNKKEEPQAEPTVPQTDNEAARTEAAQAQNSFSQEALNNVLTQNGVTAEEWGRITSPNFNIQGLMSSTAPEAQKYRNAYMAYQNMMQTPAQQQPTPAQQAQTPTQAPAQNQILPSAGGNYQADKIYDPSKTYGRQADGSYVYSNSAKELQNNLARAGYYKGTIDGYFGKQTQDALNAYLAEHGTKAEPDKGADTLTQAAQEAPKTETPSNVEQAVQNTAGSNTATSGASALYSELEDAYRNSTVDKNGRTGESQAGDSMSRALENRKVPEDFSGYTEPFVDAAGRQNQIDAINARGRSMDTYYRDMLDSMQNQPVERQSMIGNSMSEALENRQPDRLMPRGYATPANESLAGNSFSAALGNAVSAPDTNIFRQDMEELQGEMASDDIQSTGSSSEPESSEEQAMRDAYEAAMRSAGRARDIFQGLPTSEAEQMQQAREQWQQNMRTALEDQFNNPYMQQFRRDFEDVQRQFPNYSYSALADMVLFNEEMRNGQSSYYKWLANQL